MWGTWKRQEGNGGCSHGEDEMWFRFVIPPRPVRRGSQGDMGSHCPAHVGDHGCILGFFLAMPKECDESRKGEASVSPFVK